MQMIQKAHIHSPACLQRIYSTDSINFDEKLGQESSIRNVYVCKEREVPEFKRDIPKIDDEEPPLQKRTGHQLGEWNFTVKEYESNKMPDLSQI